jgi:hypothetical protein
MPYIDLIVWTICVYWILDEDLKAVETYLLMQFVVGSADWAEYKFHSDIIILKMD